MPFLILWAFLPSRYVLPLLPFACLLVATALLRLPAMIPRLRPIRAGIGVAACGIVLAASGIASWYVAARHELAAFAGPDRGMYRASWHSGYSYARARDLVLASAGPGSVVAYQVDPVRRIGAGLHRPLPVGVESLGWSPPDRVPQFDGRHTVYLFIDDAGAAWPGERVASAMRADPSYELLGQFERSGPADQIYVLRRPADAGQAVAEQLADFERLPTLPFGARVGLERIQDRPPGDLGGYFDVNRRTTPMLTISGWAFDESQGTRGDAVLVRLGDGPANRADYGLSRPDVAGHFGNPAVVESGFIAHVDLSDVPSGAYPLIVQVVARESGVKYAHPTNVMVNVRND
jgi:hypothetical protein